MKAILPLLLLLTGCTVTRTDSYEPAYSDCFRWPDKFARPKEIVAPTFVYPESLLQAGIVGEVVALVVLNVDGTPRRVSILYDTHWLSPPQSGDTFSASVIQGLKGAKWDPQKKPGVWFYQKLTFVLVDKGEKVTDSPDIVVGVVPYAENYLKGKTPNHATEPRSQSRAGSS